jgi:hypothetical protein
MNSAESRSEAIAKRMVKDHRERMENKKDIEREQRKTMDSKDEEEIDAADAVLAK